jgi:hypothetical protein
VKSFYKHHKDRETRPTLEELRQVLQSEIKMFTKVFIVVDALDECSELDADRTRSKLLMALRSLESTINLLVTSRELASIAQDFRETKRLDIQADDQDVRRYIENRIPHEPRLARHVHGHPTFQEEIVVKIIENARGMYVSQTCPRDTVSVTDDQERFLLARLHMDSLAITTNRQHARRVLENLPSEVNATYDQTMKRIEGQVESDRELAEQILSWVTYARRPLSLPELQHALAVSPGMTEMNLDAIVDEMILTSVCAGLVLVDGESKVLRLVRK